LRPRQRNWFLRRTLNYTYELIERTPEQRFVMRTGAGAVPDDNGLRVGSRPDGPDGITLMRLRNSGERAVLHPSAAAEVDPRSVVN